LNEIRRGDSAARSRFGLDLARLFAGFLVVRFVVDKNYLP
jgi:hypothetical protein